MKLPKREDCIHHVKCGFFEESGHELCECGNIAMYHLCRNCMREDATFYAQYKEKKWQKHSTRLL